MHTAQEWLSVVVSSKYIRFRIRLMEIATGFSQEGVPERMNLISFVKDSKMFPNSDSLSSICHFQ